MALPTSSPSQTSLASSLTMPLEVVALDPPWRHLLYYLALDSTQTQACRMLEEGTDLRGCALQTEEQVAGRGRFDRQWLGRPGGIYVTAVMPALYPLPWAPVGWLPLVAAMGVVGWLRGQLGLEAMLKWPNDILIEDRKIAGVLGEMRPWMPSNRPAGALQGIALVGVGINWGNHLGDAPENMLHPAANLRHWRPELSLDLRPSLVNAMLHELSCWSEQLLSDPATASEALIALADQVLWRKGETVQLTSTERGEIHGTLLGIGPQGGARLLLNDDEESIVHCGWLCPWSKSGDGSG